MASKMKKGLLRPLRYFSQIFEGREADLQIGYPTNVRHVAHIGLDSTDEGPSWMKEFHSAPLPTGVDGSDRPAESIWNSADLVLIGGYEDPRSSARTSSSSMGPTMEDSPFMSPETSPLRQPALQQPERAESSGRPKKGRKYRKKEAVDAPTDLVSGQELPTVPKKSRRRKLKKSEANKSPAAPSRLRECSTDVAAAQELDQMLQPQVMKPLASEEVGGIVVVN